MSSFTNVTVEKNANIYYEGKVTSRTVIFEDGTTKTLGIMLPGEYEFGTNLKELMEISAGKLTIKLPQESTWRVITPGESFEVPANSKFQLKITEATDYCCSYIAE